MDSDSYIFQISQKEMKRRKRALLTLLISLFLGFSLTMMSLKTIDIHSVLILLLTFLLILTSIGLLTLISFKSFSKIKVSLNNGYLERKASKLRETYLIKDIKCIFIKRTTNGNIREMKITQNSGASLFINALENFEVFYERIKKLTGTTIEETVYTEPINFDHKLFYVFFGFPIGLCTPLLASVFINLDVKTTNYVLYSFAVLTIGIGVFFMFSKPISKRYGNHKQLADFLFGSAMIILGCLIFFHQIFGRPLSHMTALSRC